LLFKHIRIVLAVIMTRMTVMSMIMRLRICMLMLSTCGAAVVTLLNFTENVVLHVALAFIWWTVALTAWVVITNAARIGSRIVRGAIVLSGM
jgi:FtsH-binding integral membrane protein